MPVLQRLPRHPTLPAWGLGTLGLLAVAGVLALASPAARAAGAPDAAQRYCKATGGALETYRFYDGSGHAYAKPAWVCNYPDASGTDPFGHAIIDLATLYADKPTLAALAYYAKPAWNGKFKTTPAKDYCLQLGATPSLQGQWSLQAFGDQIGMCMFEDGSYMEEWALFYNQAGTPRGVDLGTVMRFPNPAGR